ncbi:MAG: MBL fold metallo-hydrolase [Bacilli bacterium]|nr:MBL fold metallo-hydrolase [Bacilli bacterium]
MIRALFVCSGSKGNATLIDSGKTLIQIDMGTTLKRLKLGLAEMNKTIDDIEGVVFTHDHSDHIKGASMMAKRTPLYATEGTLDEYVDSLIFPGQEFEIGDIKIMPFKASHDAINPVNFVIQVGDERMAYITDTGIITEEGLSLIKDCDYYLMESNHDIMMEKKSHRPAYLIARVLGDEGHLSNVDSAHYACDVIGPHTKAIYLAHLSDDCNTHEVALDTYKRVFMEREIDIHNYDIRCTSQAKSVKGGDWE